MEVPDRRVNRCDAGVSGEVAGGPEAAGVADGQEYGGGGLDADSRHGHQDPGKREVVQELFDFLGHDGPLVFEFFDLSGHARDDQLHGLRPGDTVKPRVLWRRF
jgi:hypothetical protein